MKECRDEISMMHVFCGEKAWSTCILSSRCRQGESTQSNFTRSLRCLLNHLAKLVKEGVSFPCSRRLIVISRVRLPFVGKTVMKSSGEGRLDRTLFLHHTDSQFSLHTYCCYPWTINYPFHVVSLSLWAMLPLMGVADVSGRQLGI